MNDNVTVLPETKSQMTQKEIEYSIKIAQQTIKTKLTDRLTALREQQTELTANFEKEFLYKGIMKEFQDTIDSHLEMTITNESELYCLVQAYNLLSDGEIHSINELITSTNVYNFVRNIVDANCRNGSWAQNILDKGSYEFRVYIAVAAAEDSDRLNAIERDDEYIDTHNALYFNLPLPSRIITMLENCAEWGEKYDAIDKQLNDCRAKLDNMDNTLETIESQLLVEELSSTEGGKKTLELTGNIISNVIGSQVLLTNET